MGDNPTTTKFKLIETKLGKKFAFIGQHNKENEPEGLIRCINSTGNIYEGVFTKDLKINGFCVCTIGHRNMIYLGWYKNNLRNGNWMSVNGKDLKVIESGWYKEDQRIEDMKEDEVLKKTFTANQVFSGSSQGQAQQNMFEESKSLINSSKEGNATEVKMLEEARKKLMNLPAGEYEE